MYIVTKIYKKLVAQKSCNIAKKFEEIEGKLHYVWYEEEEGDYLHDLDALKLLLSDSVKNDSFCSGMSDFIHSFEEAWKNTKNVHGGLTTTVFYGR